MAYPPLTPPRRGIDFQNQSQLPQVFPPAGARLQAKAWAMARRVPPDLVTVPFFTTEVHGEVTESTEGFSYLWLSCCQMFPFDCTAI